MLKEGKISEDEAIRLLDAIKASSKEASFSDDLSKIFKKVGQSASDLGRWSYDFLSGLDLDSINVNNKQYNNSIQTTKAIDTSSLERLAIKFDVSSASLNIESWDQSTINVSASLNYSAKAFKPGSDFFDLIEDQGTFSLVLSDDLVDENFHIDYDIKIPCIQLDLLDLKTVNSKINLANVLAKQVKISTVNGSIKVQGLEAETLTIDSTNGKIILNNIISPVTKLDNVNGRIEIDQIAGKNLDVSTSQGKINIANIEDSMETIDAKTSIGNIEIDLNFYNKPIKAILSNVLTNSSSQESFDKSIFSNFVRSDQETIAYSKDYTEDSDHLLIRATTTRGKINI